MSSAGLESRNSAPAFGNPEPRPETGWQAELKLHLRDDAGTTRLARRWHRGPLRIQKPFHPDPGRRGGDLSGGQQQQLAIGRALVLEPELLILDEPTEGIQPNVVREIGDVILELNRARGLTVLLVEQKLSFARRVADGFRIMEKGRIVARGEMADLDEGLVAAHLSV